MESLLVITSHLKAHKYEDIPIGTKALIPHEGEANYAIVNQYQRKTGMILYTAYMAVIIWPDIAYVCLKLTRFNLNPSLNYY
jgi:hypothetical protein